MSTEDVLEHMVDCLEADAAVVVDNGDSDSLVDKLVAEGWTWESTSYVAGKRVRMLRTPE